MTNGAFEYAARPVAESVTEIGAEVAPTGTVTMSDVDAAELTDAFTAPKYTIFLEAVILKFVPLMVTLVPIGPLMGVKEMIEGWAATPMVITVVAYISDRNNFFRFI